MKIRNGFISNSSSSSYVILLPASFNIDSIDLDRYRDEIEDNDIDDIDVINGFRDLLSNKSLHEQDNRAIFVLQEILEPYIIVTISSGPDDEQLILADRDKIKELMNENENLLRRQ